MIPTPRLRIPWVIGLLTIFLVVTALVSDVSARTKPYSKEELRSRAELKEKDLADQQHNRLGFCRNQEKSNKGIVFQRICPEANIYYIRFYFSLFFVILLGAFTRTVMKAYEVPVPYTVVLMIYGLILGVISWNWNACPQWSTLTKVSRLNPKLALYIFLPVLIFEAAFSMKAHIFYRSAPSILILALPGMLMMTFMTAFICQQFFFSYGWSFSVACLFSSIISATDPVALVSILKEVGTTETLSVLIHGDALIKDGVAILLYKIFEKILENPNPEGNRAAVIIEMFVRITIGGPAFGWLIGKISVSFLKTIFNDPPVEVSITVVAAYLTFYIGEVYLGVSGVMAVLALGIVMSAERTCISPEVQGLVSHFWEMLSYLSNTVIFVIVGINITERAIGYVTLEDGYYIGFLYFALNVIRLLVVVALSPILSHIGYGLTWQNSLVITWGGIRGGVGIALALEVFKNPDLCEFTLIGPKFLLQMGGIVLLTLLINGTTTQSLLDMLKLTELSVGKIQDMAHAVKQVQSAQTRTLAYLKHDQFLNDSSWPTVEKNTDIGNPYLKHKINSKDGDDDNSETGSLVVGADKSMVVEIEDDDKVQAEPTVDQYKELSEEARLRLLKALKVSCWRQFEAGVLTQEAVQIIVDYIEHCEDHKLKMFHARDLKKYWEVTGILAWIRDTVIPFAFADQDDLPDEPDNRIIVKIYRICSSKWFQYFIYAMILLNMIPVIWEANYIIGGHKMTTQIMLIFLGLNILFTIIYSIEAGLKMTAFGCGTYFSSKWNGLDFTILVISIVEVTFSLGYLKNTLSSTKKRETELLKLLRYSRLLRIARAIRLFRPFLPRVITWLNARITVRIFLGYDIGKGLATSIEDVAKFLPQMIENTKVLNKFKVVLDEQRLFLVRAMGILQKDRPGIAIAVKTKHACRATLNQMRLALRELKEDGLVDDKEYEILIVDLEAKMKSLWSFPVYMNPRRPEMLLANSQFVGGNTDLLSYLLKEATLMIYSVGDIIYSIGDPSNGVHIIISGVAKIHYEATLDIIEGRDKFGIVPNSEICYEPLFDMEMNDYLTAGAVIGQLGVVTQAPRAASVTCETGVVAYHCPQSILSKAMEAFNDPYESLEGRFWRAHGMRLATAILPTQSQFQAWTLEKIKTYIETSAVPMGDKYLSFDIPSFIADVVIIYGQVVNSDDETEVFTAPCIIPKSVFKIKSVEGASIKPRFLIIASIEKEEEAEEAEDDDEDLGSSESIQRIVIAGSQRYSIGEEQIDNLELPSATVNFGVQSKMNKGGTKSHKKAADHDSSAPAPTAPDDSAPDPAAPPPESVPAAVFNGP